MVEIPDGTGTEPPVISSNAGVSPNAEPATETFPVLSPSTLDPFDPYGLLDAALAERRALVEACLYAHDRARSAGVAERIVAALATVGVAALRPDGEPFDPALHEAGGTVATDDAALDGRVAETEVIGFVDRGRVLRAPVVIVYQRKPPV